MDLSEQEMMERIALSPVIHQYRMGIEALIFAWLAETGHSLKDFEIKEKTTHTTKGDVFSTWIEPKVRL